MNYDPTDEVFTAILQEQIELSANCTFTHVRDNTSLKIFEQEYEFEIGTKIESVQNASN